MKKFLFGILTFLGIGLSFCSADGVYWSKSAGLISIVYNSGTNVLTLKDKNLGATCTDTNSGCSYGNYFQFGNNFPFSVSPSNINVVQGGPVGGLDNYGPGNYFNSNGNFYTDMSSDNSNIWGAITGTPEAMQGPCPNGYHIVDNWENIASIFVSMGFSESNSQPYVSFLKMPLPGYIEFVGEGAGTRGQAGTNGNYWGSASYSSIKGNRINFNSYSNSMSYNANKAYGHSIRCVKNVAVSPNISRTVLYGDNLTNNPDITVYYNNGNSSESIECDGVQAIEIQGLSTITSTNTFTPYFNIDYTDEDNQYLVESYSKDILYLSGSTFKKTYTGNNERILTSQGGNFGSDSDFSGYLPTFEITGGINDVTESGNIFNNFADNSLKVLLSNIPSYIQYVIIIALLFFILGFIRKFKRR